MEDLELQQFKKKPGQSPSINNLGTTDIAWGLSETP